jgi:hypothetical protein
MKRNHFPNVAALVLAVGGLAALGCETRVRTHSTPTTTETRVTTDPVVTNDPVVTPAPRRPLRDRAADVHVDVGNGRGINVDVDAPKRGPGDRDVDVNVGGPRGVNVNVDKDGL